MTFEMFPLSQLLKAQNSVSFIAHAGKPYEGFYEIAKKLTYS